MKKLVLVLSIATFVVCVVILILFITTNRSGTPILPRGITLNNIESGIAEGMVSDFKGDEKCVSKKTAIWLDRAWVENIESIITKEHGDGIRLYFAKTKPDKNYPNGRNTAVIISTYNIGPDSKNAESKSDHEDYYDHTDNFFNSKDAAITIDDATTPGALLFGVCPCTDDAKNPSKVLLISSNSGNFITCPNAYKAVNNMTEGEKINTYSEWFSLKEIERIEKDFLKHDKEDPTELADGIRIYFAKHTKPKHPKDECTTDNKSHQGRHAFIIITTKWAEVDGKLCHKDYFTTYNKTTLKLLDDPNDGGSDNGEQCLYNCTGVTLGN